jgi:hypothetical protein
MARGRGEDVVAAQQHYSAEDFRRAYVKAHAGLFTPRAWACWGLLLLNEPERPLPQRFPGSARLDWRHARES